MQEYCSNLTVNGKTFSFYDLEKAAKSHDVKVGELPYTIRILLESLLRKKDGIDVKESHISDLIKFPNFPTISEIPFKLKMYETIYFSTFLPLYADVFPSKTTRQI